MIIFISVILVCILLLLLCCINTKPSQFKITKVVRQAVAKRHLEIIRDDRKKAIEKEETTKKIAEPAEEKRLAEEAAAKKAAEEERLAEERRLAEAKRIAEEKRLAEEADTTTTPSYSDLLKRPEWQTLRKRILYRDRHFCQWCGNTNGLNVHHKYYSKYPNGKKVDPWNYPDDALITLCDKCHKKAHKKVIKVYYRKYTDNY